MASVDEFIEQMEIARARLEEAFDLETKINENEELILTINGGTDNIQLYERQGKLESEIGEYRGIIDWIELLMYSREEGLEEHRDTMRETLIRAQNFLLDRSLTEKYDDRKCVISVRGANGETADEKATELFEAYKKYAAKQGFRFEILNDEGTHSMIIHANNAMGYFRSEYGKQRFNHVGPDGRRQMAFVDVVVTPLIERPTVKIDYETEVREEYIGSSGPGGQNVNRNKNIVRLTHIPTGITAISKLKSQAQNRKLARKVLYSKVQAHYDEEFNPEPSRVQSPFGGAFRSYWQYGAPRIVDKRADLKSNFPDQFLKKGEIREFMMAYHGVNFSVPE